MIPRLIHQMWIAPVPEQAAMPPALLANCAGWAAANPDFAHRIWSLPEVLELCAVYGRADVAEAIGLCRLPSMQSDIARLFLLLVHGGVWVDLKLVARGALPGELLLFTAVLAEHFPTPERQEPAGLIAPGFMAAARGAPPVAAMLDLVVRNVMARAGDGVFGTTGGAAVTLALASFRLAWPQAARAIYVIPHADAWGVLWDVAADSPEAAARHWTRRQAREPIFALPAPEDVPTGVWQAVPGQQTGIAHIASRQGFHDFEPGPGFCWVAAGCRVFFEAPLAFDRLRINVYALPGYQAGTVAFRLNGITLATDWSAAVDGWAVVTLGPFLLRAGWNELAIAPPLPSVPAGDGRALSIAVAWLQPWIAV